MAKFTVDAAWIKYEQTTLLIPKALTAELRQVLTGEMKAIKQQMISNVSGGVLKTHSGKLAKTISGRVRLFNSGSKVWARAGSKYYIGRFWEHGFTRKGKNFAPRQWATPVADAHTARIATLIETTITKTLAKGGL
jgi:hypothetical protein